MLRQIDGDALIVELNKMDTVNVDAVEFKTDVILLVEKMILEKETPKEPIEWTDIYPHGQCKCPTCGNAVTGIEVYRHNTAFGDLEKLVRYSKCIRCGQKIKWADDLKVER